MYVVYKIRNMEIYIENEKLDLNNVLVTDYRLQMSDLKTKLEGQSVDFPSLKTLTGSKDLLILSFNEQKQESLDYGR
jgi:hypothetical protein